MINSLNTKYKEEVLAKIKEEFSLKNDLAVPTLSKIVVNIGAAEAIGNRDVLEKITDQLATISGQKPKITKAKESISTFKLKEGDQIGAMVTLRGKKAWDFFEKLIAIVMPRIRDFRGVSETKFDKLGNITMGLTEQILFPEIEYSKVDKIRGMAVSIVIKNGSPEKSKRFLELLGVPFRKVS